jgi:hypothetical protein
MFARFKATAKGDARLERTMPQYEALLGKWERLLK